LVSYAKTLRVIAFELITDACKQAKLFRVQFPKDHMDWKAIDKALAVEKFLRLKGIIVEEKDFLECLNGSQSSIRFLSPGRKGLAQELLPG